MRARPSLQQLIEAVPPVPLAAAIRWLRLYHGDRIDPDPGAPALWLVRPRGGVRRAAPLRLTAEQVVDRYRCQAAPYLQGGW